MYVNCSWSGSRYSRSIKLELTGVAYMSKKKSCRIHTLLMGNVVLSLLVFGVVVYFIIVGEYSNLQDRNAAEAVLNAISLGSLLYGSIFLVIALMAKPFLCTIRHD